MALTSSSRVLILGGTSGMGLAVATAAAAAGAQVLVGSRSGKPTSAQPAGLTTRQADVTDSASLVDFFAQAGEFDHLVYTAGDALARTTIAEYSPKEAKEFFEVRFFRALDTVRLALPTLRKNGSITLTSGAGAYAGGAGRLLGATVAGSVITAGRSLAIELAPIRVNVVAPGLVRTPLWSDLPESAAEQFFAQAATHTLTGRVPTAEDVAKTYLHLMDADAVTGTVSIVDSGSLLA
ncbi:short-chain dehydrogenase [Kineosporia sp. NBRC 101677]|uniref:SDR family oxidoreductase n=1 Tax=Kineosporia sp. NBRC 101677 TaxID=3032197 RepID=UPI0024A007B5|nr:SDR family oxidoreductase [Kineosporia sp. NBRC 101677]GLY19711.1 short-chain dehydrogenase [Kineosporia sp. NBRC 101677]